LRKGAPTISACGTDEATNHYAIVSRLPVKSGDLTYTEASAEAMSIKQWADDITAKTVAMAASCTVPPGVNRQCPAGEVDGANFAGCAHKAKVWEDLHNNPILRHFVHAWTADEEVGVSDYMSTPHMSANPSGIGWLRIPTTTNNAFDSNWESSPGAAGHSNERPFSTSGGDYTIPNVSNQHITMLIARKFTEEESKKIYDALRNQSGEPPRGAKLSYGKDFIFSKEGHISFRLPATPVIGEGNSQHTYLNPFINSEHTSSSSNKEAGGKSNINSTSISGNLYIPENRQPPGERQQKTMAGDSKLQGIGDYSISKKTSGAEVLYAMGPKCVMNKASTYILYTPADEDHILNGYKYKATGQTSKEYEASVAGTERYYLLYNPINSIEFRRFYQSLMQTSIDATTFDPAAATFLKHYDKNPKTVYDPSGCGTPIEVPSWSSIISRYCNAFTVTGLKTFAGFHFTKHYADPICPFALGNSSSFDAFVNNNNMTNQSTREVFYRQTRQSTPYDSYTLWKPASGRIQSNKMNGAQIWACPSHGAKSNDSFIQEWLDENNMINKHSTSFMKDLINSKLNNRTQKKWTDAQTSISRTIGTYDSVGKFNDDIDAPTCIVPPQMFNTCTQIVNIAGDVDKSKLGQDMECGGVSTLPDGEDGGLNLAEQEQARREAAGYIPHACESITIVPDCPDSSLGGVKGAAAANVNDANGNAQWTGCCISTSGGYLDCPAKAADGSCSQEGGEKTSVPATAQEREIASLNTQMTEINRRITKASNIALTAKNNAPTDIKIVSLADTVATETEAYLPRAATMSTDIVGISINNNEAAVQININALLDDLILTEKITIEISTLIQAGYILGFKKMYVFGGIGAIVFLILLIVLMKRK